MSAKVIRLLRFTIDKPTIRLFFIRFEPAGSHPETIRFILMAEGARLLQAPIVAFQLAPLCYGSNPLVLIPKQSVLIFIAEGAGLLQAPIVAFQ